MKKLLLLLTVSTGILSQASAQEFNLKGELKSFKPIDKIFFSYNNADTRVFDSIQVTNGTFQIKGTIAEPVIAFMSIKYVRKPGESVTDDVKQFFLEPATMNLVATSTLKNAQFTGSKGQPDYEKLTKAEKEFGPQIEKQLGEISAARRANNRTEVKKLEKNLDALKEEYANKIYVAFLKKNPQSPVGLYAVGQYRLFEPDNDKVLALFNKLPASLQQLPSGVKLKEKIQTGQKTAVGKYAMDFTQNDTLGNPVKLSSFRGKYVLLDFWASWCKPCRAENPNVVKAFNKYKNKNFTVLSVSLDAPNGKDKWMKAIHDDGLTWTHVSDLKFWSNEVAKQYGINSVPQNLLIDPQGKIVAKNLRGEALEEELASLIQL